jgi:hypothetical protein
VDQRGIIRSRTPRKSRTPSGFALVRSHTGPSGIPVRRGLRIAANVTALIRGRPCLSRSRGHGSTRNHSVTDRTSHGQLLIFAVLVCGPRPRASHSPTRIHPHGESVTDRRGVQTVGPSRMDRDAHGSRSSHGRTRIHTDCRTVTDRREVRR